MENNNIKTCSNYNTDDILLILSFFLNKIIKKELKKENIK